MVGPEHDIFALRSDEATAATRGPDHTASPGSDETSQRRPWRWPGALQAWLIERRLGAMGAATLAGLAAGLLFAVGGLLRLACDVDGCPAYAGAPASMLESIAIVALLIGLAATGIWIAGITQRTWAERLRLQRVEMELQDDEDAARLRRIDAILDEASQVPTILAQSRFYLWSGLLVAVGSLVLLPWVGSTFAEHGGQAGYVLPVVLLAALAGIAAVVRGLSLGAAARRLTRPLRPDKPVAEPKPSRKQRRRAAAEA